MAEDKYLVIANAYPNDSNIYNYGFLHRRVKKYLDAGLAIDVFRIDTNEPELRTYVFDGVTVTTGNRDIYTQYIFASDHASFLVHFPLDYIIAPTKHPQTVNSGHRLASWLRDPKLAPAMVRRRRRCGIHG